MWLIVKGKCILFLLTIGPIIRARSIDEETKAEVIGFDADDERGEIVEVTYEHSTTDFPLQNLTTKEPFRIIEIYNTQSPEDVKIVNTSSDFKPSIHLGEIGQPRVSSGPFNSIQHVKFDNSINPKYEQLHNIALSPQTTSQSFVHDASHLIENDSRQVDSEKDLQGGQVKFEDGTSYILENSGVRFEDGSRYNHLQVKPIHESVEPHYEVMEHQQLFRNPENPVHGHVAVLGKPVRLQALGQNYELGATTSFDGSPYQGAHDYNQYQPALQDYQATKPPDNNLVYVHQQESSFTRTRKFPYSFYQGPIGYHEFTFIEDHQLSPYFKRRRLSPWKKLVHLIGAFLPLGLLLATLTPNVVKIDNTTQSNIVLSKLRVADLPVEHKRARLMDESEKDCEDRSMCVMILAGGKTGSNLMQNILWNIAVRTSEKTAKDNGLEEIFAAAKKKDCSIIAC